MKKMKTFLMGAISLAMIGTATLSLIGCKNDEQDLNFETAYDYSAIAGIGILNTQVATAGVSGYDVTPTGMEQTQKDEIVKNLAIAQNLANNGITKTETRESDKEGYKICYTIKATDYTGEEKEYVFYYNQTDISSREDILEKEREYKLDGLVIFGGQEYNMTGKQEMEDDESELTFKIAIDNDNYVVIEQETERNEQEFQYTAYKNRVKTFETEVEFEVNRNGVVELQFEIFDRENNVAKEYAYDFYKKDGENFARIRQIEKGEILTVLATVKITSTANGYEYTFVND